MGIRSLSAYVTAKILTNFGDAAHAAGARHIKGMPGAVGRGAVRPYAVVEFDRHRLDVRLKIVIRDPLGFEQEFEIERIWLLVIIDVCSRAVLGYHLVLSRDYSRYDVIKTIEQALTPHRPRTFSLTYRCEEAWVQGDRTRLEQVVTNLIGNALKYTPEGGCIDIAVTATATNACLTVRDTGMGIAPELMPRLFDIFVQGNVTIDRPQGGLGIGLSLVHQLVSLHEGTIEAASEGVGKGSTFKLCLPRALARTDVAAREAFVLDASRHTGTVIIIDDNEEVRAMAVANLSAAGYTMLEAANGIDGIALAGQQPLCAVIVDIGLPGMDGYQVADALRADPLTASLRLVALTGYGLEADRKRAFAAGFDAHFVKPADFPQLVASLTA